MLIKKAPYVFWNRPQLTDEPWLIVSVICCLRRGRLHGHSIFFKIQNKGEQINEYDWKIYTTICFFFSHKANENEGNLFKLFLRSHEADLKESFHFSLLKNLNYPILATRMSCEWCSSRYTFIKNYPPTYLNFYTYLYSRWMLDSPLSK